MEMSTGIMVLVVLTMVILGQLFVLDRRRRREHRELIQRLDEIRRSAGP